MSGAGRVSGARASTSESDNEHAERDGNPAVECPSQLPRHEAAGQDANPLKEPHSARQDEKATDDREECAHGDWLLNSSARSYDGCSVRDGRRFEDCMRGEGGQQVARPDDPASEARGTHRYVTTRKSSTAAAEVSLPVSLTA